MQGYSRSREDRIDLLSKKYYTMEEKVLGCLGDGAEATDYVLCNGDSDLLPPLVQKDEIRYQYNQYKNKRSYVSCTVFAAIGMLSDLINYEFTYDQIKEVDELTYTTDNYPKRIRGQGYWVKYAVGVVADRYNASELSKKYGKVAYYRISKFDDDIVENVLDKLYTIDGNLHLTDEYYKDKEDGMIDGTDFGTLTNGHSIDIIKNRGQRSVKDSGSNPAKNIYGLKNKLSKITNFGPNFYVYVLVNDHLEEIKRLNKIKSESLTAIEHLGNIYNLINDGELQRELHKLADKLRAKIKTCDDMLKGLL